MEIREVNGYVQDADGKWIMTEEVKAEAMAMYYSGRLAYSKENPQKTIGRYNSVGEVIMFKKWTDVASIAQEG